MPPSPLCSFHPLVSFHPWPKELDRTRSLLRIRVPSMSDVMVIVKSQQNLGSFGSNHEFQASRVAGEDGVERPPLTMASRSQCCSDRRLSFVHILKSWKAGHHWDSSHRHRCSFHPLSFLFASTRKANDGVCNSSSMVKAILFFSFSF